MRDFNNQIKLLKPFPCFCYSIGMLPTSFDASLTYEEQIIFLMNYIKETLIPTVNENGKAVQELQELYVQLENFVNNYFDNLDVQNEINNKLDAMVEDGTLDKIINHNIFHNLNTAIVTLNNTNTLLFNCVDDMVNFISPSGAPTTGDIHSNMYVKTKSFYLNQNKGGATYYITDTTQVVDNIRIFPLKNNLYAILQDNPNPYCYGAYGNGTNDDTNALQTCINHNRSMNLTPHTVYKISSNLNLIENFELNGNWATINSSQSDNVNNINAQNINNISINNLRLIASNRGLCFTNCENIRLYNIYVSSSNWATLFRLCRNVNADTIYINQNRTSSYSNSDGIHINGLINAVFKNVNGSTDDDFIALNADELNQNYGDIINVKFINCSTDFNSRLINPNINNSTYRAIRFQRLQSNISNITFENCHFTADNQECIIYNGNNTKEIYNINFINCSFNQSSSNGVSLARLEQPFNKLIFNNCYFQFSNNLDNGYFTLLGNGNWIEFTDCKIENNDTSRTFLSINANISNITFDKLRGTLNNLTLVYFRSGSSSKLKIINCALANNNGQLILINNSGQPSHIIIANNYLYNFQTFIACHIKSNGLLLEFNNNSPTSSLRNVLFDGVKNSSGAIDPVASIENVRFRGDVYAAVKPTTLITGDNFYLVDIDHNNAYPQFCSHQVWQQYAFTTNTTEQNLNENI